MRLNNFKQHGAKLGKAIVSEHQSIHNLAVVIALMTAAIWAVYIFTVSSKPAIVISSFCDSHRLEDYRQLVRVTLEVENSGNRSKEYEEGVELIAIMNDLSPVRKLSSQIPSGAFDFSSYADHGIFDVLGRGVEPLQDTIIISPGDKETFYFNFIINPLVKKVSIYASIRNGDDDIKEKGFYNTCDLSGIDSNVVVKDFTEDAEDKHLEYLEATEDGLWCVNRNFTQQQPQQQLQSRVKASNIFLCDNNSDSKNNK